MAAPESGSHVGPRLRKVTGVALLVSMAGIVFDAIASQPDGTVGLIPAYLGFTVGTPCLVLVVWRLLGPVPGVVAAVGVAGQFVWWFSYPAHVTFAGLGQILLGGVCLVLPGRARFVSPLWVASGVLFLPELVAEGVTWGLVSGFMLLGLALGGTGAWALLDLQQRGADAS